MLPSAGPCDQKTVSNSEKGRALPRTKLDSIRSITRLGAVKATEEVWKRTFLERLYNPAYGQKSVNTLAIEAYAAVQQALIGLALEERIEVTKDGRIRIKPER